MAVCGFRSGSITVYHASGFIAQENAVADCSNVKLEGDGTLTVDFGSKLRRVDVTSRLDAPDGSNDMLLAYRPDASVLDRGYVLSREDLAKR